MSIVSLWSECETEDSHAYLPCLAQILKVLCSFLFSVFSVETNFCPVCNIVLKNVDRHLRTVHHILPDSEEQRILCKLGSDRIPLEGDNFSCPLFRREGCTALIMHPKHHLKKCHPTLSPDQITELLRPLRYKLAMRKLGELRTAKVSLVTDLDLIFFEAEVDEPQPSTSSGSKCIKAECRSERRKCAVLQKLNAELRKQLSFAQKVSRDFSYN